MTARPGDKEPVCGRQEYTVTEDRPIEKERRTTVLEHHLYEKTFVVETRLVGERPLPGDPRVSLADIMRLAYQRKSQSYLKAVLEHITLSVSRVAVDIIRARCLLQVSCLKSSPGQHHRLQ